MQEFIFAAIFYSSCVCFVLQEYVLEIDGEDSNDSSSVCESTTGSVSSFASSDFSACVSTKTIIPNASSNNSGSGSCKTINASKIGGTPGGKQQIFAGAATSANISSLLLSSFSPPRRIIHSSGGDTVSPKPVTIPQFLTAVTVPTVEEVHLLQQQQHQTTATTSGPGGEGTLNSPVNSLATKTPSNTASNSSNSKKKRTQPQNGKASSIRNPSVSGFNLQRTKKKGNKRLSKTSTFKSTSSFQDSVGIKGLKTSSLVLPKESDNKITGRTGGPKDYATSSHSRMGSTDGAGFKSSGRGSIKGGSRKSITKISTGVNTCNTDLGLERGSMWANTMKDNGRLSSSNKPVSSKASPTLSFSMMPADFLPKFINTSTLMSCSNNTSTGSGSLTSAGSCTEFNITGNMETASDGGGGVYMPLVVNSALSDATNCAVSDKITGSGHFKPAGSVASSLETTIKENTSFANDLKFKGVNSTDPVVAGDNYFTPITIASGVDHSPHPKSVASNNSVTSNPGRAPGDNIVALNIGESINSTSSGSYLSHPQYINKPSRSNQIVTTVIGNLQTNEKATEANVIPKRDPSTDVSDSEVNVTPTTVAP